MSVLRKLTFLLVLFYLLSACSSLKNIKYFSDIPDSVKRVQLGRTEFIEPKIQPDDILSISIENADPEATKILNQVNLTTSAVGNTTAGSTGGQTLSGILVDSDGNIEFPVIGKINVAGLTTKQARELIRTEANKKFTNTSVNIRFANFRITVLGEVNKPGVYVISNEKVNILDALGLAGDLTIYGKRDNIALIRQQTGGKGEFIRLSLNDSKILSSPYYYLKQNDYIYVESSKTKIVASDAIQNRNVSIITAIAASLLSVAAILISTNKL